MFSLILQNDIIRRPNAQNLKKCCPDLPLKSLSGLTVKSTVMVWCYITSGAEWIFRRWKKSTISRNSNMFVIHGPIQITWWRMMTSSNGNIFRVTGPLCGEFTGLRWIPRTEGQWRGALMFSLICAWINAWINNRRDGDLRRYRAHYDFTVMGKNKRG